MHTVFSFLLFSLSLSLSVFERQQQQARQSSRPRRGLLAFSCHSGENTAESRRARVRACACVHVQALGYLGKKEKKKQRYISTRTCHRTRRGGRRRKIIKKNVQKKKKSERGSELSILSQRKSPTRITGVH